MARKKKPQKKQVNYETKADVLADLNKQFGEFAIYKMSSGHTADVEAISTGSLSLDVALGVGGLPRGRVIEIFGLEAYGKTTVALSTMAQAQRMGHHVAIVDMEHAIVPAWVERCGVDLDEAYLSQPNSGEEALNIVLALCKSGFFSIVFLDSVASLLPKVEEEGTVGQSFVGLQARLMGQALRKIVPTAKKSNTMIIFANQMRMKIGQAYGDPYTTSGGMSLKFHSSVRVHVRANFKAFIKKNKVAAPFKEGIFTITEDHGVDSVACALKVGEDLEVVKRAGSWYEVNGQRYQGSERMVNAMWEDPDQFYRLQKQIRSILGWEDQPEIILSEFNSSASNGVDMGWDDLDDDDDLDLSDTADSDVEWGDIEEKSPAKVEQAGARAEIKEMDKDWRTPGELVLLLREAGTFETAGKWVKGLGRSFDGWGSLREEMEKDEKLYAQVEEFYLLSTGVIIDPTS